MTYFVNFLQRQAVPLRHFKHVEIHFFRCWMWSQVVFNQFISMLLHKNFFIDVIHAFSKLLKSRQRHFVCCIYD